MKKRKFLATSGLVTTLLLAGSNPALAKAYSSEMPLEIRADDFKEELRSGKTPRQILEEQGLSPAQIQKLFNQVKRQLHD